jgi:hypothetical protein
MSATAAVFIGLLALGLVPGCERIEQNPETVYAEPRPPVRDPDAPGLPVPFDRHAVYNKTLHVHPEGDDAGGNGTAESPFATVSRAMLEAVPGTRILLASGRHAPIGSIADLRGEPGAPIAIVGAEGSIIDGGLTNEVIAGIHLSNPKFVVLEGLTVERAYPHGISIDDGGDYATPGGPVILRRLNLRNIGRGKNNDCLKMSGVDDFQVLDSEFANCDEGEAIDMVGCHRGFISGNTFRKTPLTAVQTKGGSSDIVIHGNRFIEVTARSVNLGGHTGDAYFRPPDAIYEAARIQVLSNIFYRSGDTAIAFTGCVACLAAHNTIIDPQGHVVRLLEEHPDRAIGRGGWFTNNLVAFKAKDVQGLISAGPNSRPAAFNFGENLWFPRDNSTSISPEETLSLSLMPPALWGIDPQFKSPAVGDYRLVASIHGVGPGSATTRSSLPDFAGVPYGLPPTVGAHSSE